MFDAMLKKDNDPLSAAEIVEFPIPEAQYEETIRALNGIQSGAVVEQDCFVADIGTADCPALERLIGTMANVDELDWLGKQLESFDRYELLQFNAAVERFGLLSNNKLSEQLRIKAVEEVRPVRQRVHEIAGAICQIVAVGVEKPCFFLFQPAELFAELVV